MGRATESCVKSYRIQLGVALDGLRRLALTGVPLCLTFYNNHFYGSRCVKIFDIGYYHTLDVNLLKGFCVNVASRQLEQFSRSF